MATQNDHAVLFVDDEPSITKALRRMFRKEPYRVLTASSGSEALTLLENAEHPVSLIISDQRMPGMNGAEFLERAKSICPEAIRFLLTGYSDMEAIVDAVNKGEIHRYLTKPWNDSDVILQVRQGIAQVELAEENRRLQALTERQNGELRKLNGRLEEKVCERTRQLARKNIALQKANRMLQKGFVETVRLLTALVKTLNPFLGASMQQTAELSRRIAEGLGLDMDACDAVEIGGMIHDIGLLGLSEETLAREPETLKGEPGRIWRQHPVVGSLCVESVDPLKGVGEMILHHHEDFDGQGFPNRLKGEEIPVGARIIRVAGDYVRHLKSLPRDDGRLRTLVDRMTRRQGGARRGYPPETIRTQIAKNRILMHVSTCYDAAVATQLIKALEDSCRFSESGGEGSCGVVRVSLPDLKAGMTLVSDLRLKDGRLLLAKGSRLKAATIETLRRIGRKKLIDGGLYVAEAGNAP